jgi:hypothetical protein
VSAAAATSSAFAAGVCRECGCTEAKACAGGCAWADTTQTLCTTCAAKDRHAPDVLEPTVYEAELLRLRLVGQIIADINLAGLARTISRSHSVGAILDPTLYHHGARRLEIVQGLVTAAIRFQKAVNEFDRGMNDTEAAAQRSLEFLTNRAQSLSARLERGGA